MIKQGQGIVGVEGITSIRQSLKYKYEQDQHIQQVIEKIGIDDGLTQLELIIVYKAYMEVKERLFYTSALHNLWNQIEEVQNRLSLLHVYDMLEDDLSDDDIDNKIIDEHIIHTIVEGRNVSDSVDLDVIDVNADADNRLNERTEIQNISLKPIDLTNVKVPDIVMELLNNVYSYVDSIQEGHKPSKKEKKENLKAEMKRNKKTIKELKKLTKREGKKLDKNLDKTKKVVTSEKSDKEKKIKKLCTKCKKYKGVKCKHFKN